MKVVFKTLMTFALILVWCRVVSSRRVRRGWLSAGQPTRIKCAFNPCSVPNFCGTGRTCEMDENCRHHCECEVGSQHKLCMDQPESTTPRALKCTFNPCDSPAFACSQGRKCVLGEHCMPECACTDVSNHPDCIDKTEKTEEGTTQGETCKLCVHGTCRRNTCKCDNGWKGDTCNETMCTMRCSDGQYCHYVNEKIQICVKSSDKPSSTDMSDVPTTTTQTITNNVCFQNDYVVHDLRERTCSSGEVCKHGICLLDNNDDGTCRCDVGAFGKLCELTCCLNCGEFGQCSIDDDMKEVCRCKENYTGINCTDLLTEYHNATYAPPKEVTWHYWVVGACALVLVILITLMVVVPYILWRNRVILVMKVVHYFQGYEDDDDRQWDAFISYKSNKADEIFVVKTLFPKLEKDLGFKVNVHFRDFVPGETIANNIISAVQGSRRTILVITPSYVTSEFTKFEYQIAQQEMLKRKHRIIPILLEDISEVKETMDPNLKVILNSVTYIEWPKCGTEKKLEKFWKRLELSMPKMKNRLVESNNVSSLTNGHVIMSKPEAISISFVDDKGKIGNGNFSGVYNTIDDNIADIEVEYDTLNDSEMESKVLRQKSISEPKEYVNAIKIDL